MGMMFARRRREQYQAKLKARKAAEQKLAKAALVAAGKPLVEPDKQLDISAEKSAQAGSQAPEKQAEKPAEKPAKEPAKKGK